MSTQTEESTTVDAAERLSTAPPDPASRPVRPGRRRPFAAALRVWRQLTSMRTALLLLFLLAVAAVPGSLLPQRSVDPTLVQLFIARHRTWGPLLDRLSGYDVFAAPWFAAIYALLFISLIGCLVPRVRLHTRALLRKPPKTPAHPARLASGIRFETTAAPEEVIRQGRAVLRSRRFRVAADTRTVSAEKGYLRETGNLVFHISLVVLLAGIAVGSMFGYNGKVLVNEGDGFSNTLVQYDNFSHGALVDTDELSPFTFRLQSFVAEFQDDGTPKTYRAQVAFQKTPAAAASEHTIKVNDPLTIGEAKVYLINHGYSVHAVLRDKQGAVVYDAYVPCVASNTATLTSNCTIKIPDTGIAPVGKLAQVQQLGITAGLVPTFDENVTSGSTFPALRNPRIAGVQAWVGNLGIDAGTSQNVYVLDTSRMKPVIVEGSNGTSPPILDPRNPSADTVTGLPDGLTLSFDGIRNYAVFSVKYDPGKGLVLWAAIAMLLGLIGSLLVRRRRVWLRVTPAASTGEGATAGRTVVEMGGLSRTGSFTSEFDDLVGRVRARLPEQGR